jgi:hypothetical protein
MTAIFYPDCTATSLNGKFTLEACSPDNGTINHRNGRPPSEDDFGFKYREHQDEFRYRLIDNTRTPLLARLFGKGGGSVVWERWQEIGEDSPHELVVSDDGWSILRTHGFRPEVIVVSPSGKDTLRVRIADRGVERYLSSTVVPISSWTPEHLIDSTAGLYWTEHSWRYFFQHQGSNYFVWRTSWGQLLLLDLQQPGLLMEPEPSTPLMLAVIEGEKQGVCDLLSAFTGRMSEVRNWFQRRTDEEAEQEGIDPRIRFLTSAFHLAGVHRLATMIPRLREWEEIDCPGMSMGSSAMVNGWWLEVQYFRPILHHALRLLGQEPLGLAAYHFRDNDKQRYPMPERIPDRNSRASQVRQDMSAEDVLNLLGSPDHIRRRSRQEGTIYRWSEDWEYDFRAADKWTTFRITWEEERRKGQIIQIETVPAYWLHSDERESEILRF